MYVCIYHFFTLLLCTSLVFLCFVPPLIKPAACLFCQDTVWASAKLRQWQREMAALWKRQDEKGGIIDVERDKKLLVIGATDPSPP